MTSIEWFTDEVFRTLNYHYQGNLPAVIAGLKISEAKHKAIEMYKNEINRNDSQQEISDSEINDIADRLGISTIPMTYFIEGAKWYREQLKQKQ